MADENPDPVDTPETDDGEGGSATPPNYEDSPYFIGSQRNRGLIDRTDPNYNSDEGIEYRESLDRAREVDARNEARRVVRERERADDALAMETAFRWGREGSPSRPTQAQLAAATGPNAVPLFGHQTREEARRLAREKSPIETWEEYRERQAAVEGMFGENDKTRARLESRGELQFEGESDKDFEGRRARYRGIVSEAVQRARQTGQPVEYEGPQSQLSWEIDRLNAKGLNYAEFADALDDLSGLVRFDGSARSEDRAWLEGQAQFYRQVDEAVAEGRAGTPEALERTISLLGEVYHSPNVTPDQRAYLDRVIEAHADAKARTLEAESGSRSVISGLDALTDPYPATSVSGDANRQVPDIEAALATQGLTPDEIGYVRERQGGSLTKFDQDDADAVTAVRVEGHLTAQGLTPDEIAYVRNRQGGNLTKFDQDDADAVTAMRVEGHLAAQGLTPAEIAYVSERQGGALTKFDQDDANAVTAMRRVLAARAASEAGQAVVVAHDIESEFEAGIVPIDLAAQIAQSNTANLEEYQRRADLWESEVSMGPPEVNPELAEARTIRAVFDSGEQDDPSGGFPGFLVTPEDAQAMNRDARQIIKGFYPEPPVESVSEAEAAEARLERILNRGVMPAPDTDPGDTALLDAIETARQLAGVHAQEYQKAWTEGRHDDAEKAWTSAQNFSHVYKTLIPRVDTHSPSMVGDPNSPFNPELTGGDIADLTSASLGLAGQVVLRSSDPPRQRYTAAGNRAFQAGVQVASIQSQIDWNEREISRLKEDLKLMDEGVSV